MPNITYAQALNEALREEMKVDPRIFLMGEDIGHHGGIFRVTKDLIDEFCWVGHWCSDGWHATSSGIVIYGLCLGSR